MGRYMSKEEYRAGKESLLQRQKASALREKQAAKRKQEDALGKAAMEASGQAKKRPTMVTPEERESRLRRARRAGDAYAARMAAKQAAGTPKGGDNKKPDDKKPDDKKDDKPGKWGASFAKAAEAMGGSGSKAPPGAGSTQRPAAPKGDGWRNSLKRAVENVGGGGYGGKGGGNVNYTPPKREDKKPEDKKPEDKKPEPAAKPKTEDNKPGKWGAAFAKAAENVGGSTGRATTGAGSTQRPAAPKGTAANAIAKGAAAITKNASSGRAPPGAGSTQRPATPKGTYANAASSAASSAVRRGQAALRGFQESNRVAMSRTESKPYGVDPGTNPSKAERERRAKRRQADVVGKAALQARGDIPPGIMARLKRNAGSNRGGGSV